MRWSQLVIPTLKEAPSDAEAISHILMIRAGLIRRLAAGAYSYLPLGLRSLQKVQQLIREEMNQAGALEVLLPSLQPAEIWKESGRLDVLGKDMISFVDRHGNQMIMGPTHEEVITSLARDHFRSYRDLPKILYQIQTKFRDEIRPRFGVIRSREFIMKDAYSFDRDWEGLDVNYRKMFDAYTRIFERCGLKTVSVEAGTGVMGGDVSHEFMVISERGEDIIAVCSSCSYAASLEKAECAKPPMVVRGSLNDETKKIIQKTYTPHLKTVEKVAEFLKVTPQQIIKSLIYLADGKPMIALVRGDHEVNESKLKKILKCQILQLANPATIERVTGAAVGFSGPIGLKEKIVLVADTSIQEIQNGVVGANQEDYHLIGVSTERDIHPDQWEDIRFMTEQDICPKCRSPIHLQTAIEVGHIFKLGTKYTKAMRANFLDQDGKEKEIIMGCYGMGVNRILAAVLEQSHDEMGIIWPLSIAPFQLIIVLINPSNKSSLDASENLYKEFLGLGIDVLLDDRDERAGVKLKDADLIGIPCRVVIGEKNLAQGKVEVKLRKERETLLMDPKDVIPWFKKVC